MPTEAADRLSWAAPKRMPIRILIAYDHSVVPQGRESPGTIDPKFEVVGEASDGLKALHMVMQAREAADPGGPQSPRIGHPSRAKHVLRQRPVQ